jgi:hypothetical protein
MFDFSQLGPISVFVNSRLAAWFWFVVAMVMSVVAAFAPYLTIKEQGKDENTVIISPEDRVIYTRTIKFKKARDYQAYFAKLAAEAYFDRNPLGFDKPELINAIYLEDARAKITSEWKAIEAEFALKKIYQSVKISSLKVGDYPAVNNRQAILVTIEGQLFLNYVDNGVPFNVPKAFRAEFIMVRNDDLQNNAFLPLVVDSFRTEYIKAEIKQEAKS